MKNARILNNVAIDVTDGNPAELYHTDLASQFVPVPQQVEHGWRLDTETDTWGAPSQADAAAPAALLRVSPVEFKLLFSSLERISIKTSADPVVQDFFEIVNDPRLTFVDLNLQSTKDAVSYLAMQSLISDARAAEILTGQVK